MILRVDLFLFLLRVVYLLPDQELAVKIIDILCELWHLLVYPCSLYDHESHGAKASEFRWRLENIYRGDEQNGRGTSS